MVAAVPDSEQVFNLVTANKVFDVNNEWISREDLNVILMLVGIYRWCIDTEDLVADNLTDF